MASGSEKYSGINKGRKAGTVKSPAQKRQKPEKKQ
jgi:hypothetical protein